MFESGIHFDSYDEWILINKNKLGFFANISYVEKEGLEINFDDPGFTHEKYFEEIIYARIREQSGNRYAINYTFDAEKQELTLLDCVYLTPQTVDKNKGNEFYKLNRELINAAVKDFVWG